MHPPIPTPLPWHSAPWRDLLARHAADRLPHALLLTGLPGLGQRQFAEALAAALLCRAPAADGSACGQCRTCVLLRAGTHPDYRVVEPEEEGKQITVDRVREVAGFQSLKAQYGDRQVVVVDPADRMNVNAANALLKTLEEPTDGTVLLLCSSRPASLLPTIRSRCQQVALRPDHGAATRAWLAERLGGDSGRADLLLAMSAGAPLTALALGQEGQLERRSERFERFAAIGDGSAAIAAAALWWNDDDVERLLRWFEEWFIDMTRLRLAPATARLTHPDLAGRLKALAEQVDLLRIVQLAERSREARRLLGGQINRQLLLENLLLAWAARTAPARRRRPEPGAVSLC